MSSIYLANLLDGPTPGLMFVPDDEGYAMSRIAAIGGVYNKTGEEVYYKDAAFDPNETMFGMPPHRESLTIVTYTFKTTP